MLKPRNASLLAAALLLTSAGCTNMGPVQIVQATHVKPLPPKAAAVAPIPGQLPCPVTIQLINKDGDQVRMISDETCLSLSGDQVALPTTMKLTINNLRSIRNYDVCQDDPKETVPGVKECLWNGRFRHTYPWTVVLRSNETGGLPGQIKAVRVFLNGELIYKWIPDSLDSTNELTIQGQDLKRRLLPEGAPMDVRIIPHDIQVDQATLDRKVTARHSQWKAQGTAVVGALMASPSLANGQLREHLECIKYRAESAFYHAAQLARATDAAYTGPVEPTKPNPKTCPDTPAAPPVGVKSSSAGYASLKTKTSQDLEQLQQQLISQAQVYATQAKDEDRQALKDFKQEARDWWDGKGAWWATLDKATGAGSDRMVLRKDLLAFMDKSGWEAGWGPRPTWNVATNNSPKWSAAPPTKDEILWLQTRGTVAELEAVLASADAMVTQGLGAIDDTVSLVAQLRRDTVRIAGSTDEQARLFLRVASSLQGSSPFEQLHDNPEPLPGERALGMNYSDHFQLFFIAPWTGFPVSLDGKADFTAANLTPLIDMIGLRVQWAGSRFADARVGVGLTGLAFSEKDSTDPSGSRTLYRFAPEANIGIANLKLGLAIATGPDLVLRDRFRFLVGADLFKLLSGNNLEAFTR